MLWRLWRHVGGKLSLAIWGDLGGFGHFKIRASWTRIIPITYHVLLISLRILALQTTPPISFGPPNVGFEHLSCADFPVVPFNASIWKMPSMKQMMPTRKIQPWGPKTSWANPWQINPQESLKSKIKPLTKRVRRSLNHATEPLAMDIG